MLEHDPYWDDDQAGNGGYNTYLTLPPMTLPKSNFILRQG